MSTGTLEGWKERATGLAWALAMRMEAATWRRELFGWQALDALTARGEGVMIVLWHGQYRPVLSCVRDRHCLLVTTRTHRGRIIEQAARRLGHRAVLRPPALRGEAAIEWLSERLAGAARAVLVADGPSGPPRRVKRGVIELARRLRLRLVPCAAASGTALERRRWDRQEIPLPFSRVAVVVGDPLPALPRSLDARQLGAWRACTARAIDRCRSRALVRVGRASVRG